MDSSDLLPCPACGDPGSIQLQTPAGADGVVQRVFYRCQACALESPDFADWEPGAGRLALREFWNEWVREQ